MRVEMLIVFVFAIIIVVSVVKDVLSYKEKEIANSTSVPQNEIIVDNEEFNEENIDNTANVIENAVDVSILVTKFKYLKLIFLT